MDLVRLFDELDVNRDGFLSKDEMLEAYEKASGKQLQHKLAERRPGDVAVVYGDASLALKELGWKAELGLTDMCEDSWRWISNNPDGFN